MTTQRRVMVLTQSLALPSSYTAALQYREHLANAGYDAVYIALDSPVGHESRTRAAYWARRLRLRGVSDGLKADIVRRWEDEIVERAKSYDVVYAIKLPSLTLHRRLIALEHPRLLVCFADAFWLPFARSQGWQDLDAILQAAHAVVCVNDYTAEYARRRNPRVFIVNDSPQTEDFDRVRGTVTRRSDQVTLGWIGSALTAGSLYRIWEPLEELFAEFPDIRLRLVGTGAPTLLNIPRFEKVRWSVLAGYDQAGMIDEVLRMDIGLFPLFRGEDTLARGALKAAIYMSGEAAVVAQRYGENTALIQDGVNGMLADTAQEWHDRLTFLIQNPAERRAIARRGLEAARARFSRQQTFEQLRAAIDSV
jgi:glycosyltransferase involved in cell wall biosynthesis